MPDLHGWITQQINRVEALAREQESSLWQVALGEDSVAAAMLRRCTADRKILAEHKAREGGWYDYYACEGCGYDGADYCSEPMTAHVNDCPTLLALAEGYGLTDEQRAGLDRPEAEQPKRGPGMGMPDVLVEQMVRVSLAAVPPALRGPNWKARP